MRREEGAERLRLPRLHGAKAKTRARQGGRRAAPPSGARSLCHRAEFNDSGLVLVMQPRPRRPPRSGEEAVAGNSQTRLQLCRTN